MATSAHASVRGQLRIVVLTSILLWVLLLSVSPLHSTGFVIVSFAALAVAPVPVWLMAGHREAKSRVEAFRASEEREKLKLELDTVRYRAVRLREELAAAESQARLSRQLTLLGRFTAGFLHEFNNPLAILLGPERYARAKRAQARSQHESSLSLLPAQPDTPDK